MKQVNISDLEIGKYYLRYKVRKGFYKKASIFMYESVFTDPAWEHSNEYFFINGKQVLTNSICAPCADFDEIILWELDDDEIFKHVMFEEITINL